MTLALDRESGRRVGVRLTYQVPDRSPKPYRRGCMASLNPARGNPNAATSLASTIGGGQAIVNIAQAFGWHISTGWGITIAGGASYVVLYIGREGLTGVWHGLMHGFNNQPKGTP